MDEYETLKLLMNTGYERAAATGFMEEGTGRMTAAGIEEMVKYSLNPDMLEVTEEEEETIRSWVSTVRENEGLNDDNVGLNVNFLNKGSPYKHVKDLLLKLRAGRREASGGRRLSGGVGFGDLYEHEIEVDTMVKLPEGETGRRLLE